MAYAEQANAAITYYVGELQVGYSLPTSLDGPIKLGDVFHFQFALDDQAIATGTNEFAGQPIGFTLTSAAGNQGTWLADGGSFGSSSLRVSFDSNTPISESLDFLVGSGSGFTPIGSYTLTNGRLNMTNYLGALGKVVSVSAGDTMAQLFNNQGFNPSDFEAASMDGFFTFQNSGAGTPEVDFFFDIIRFEAAPIPEPGSAGLLALAAAGMIAGRRRKGGVYAG